jgi:NADH-quinone oxidoreductase subunit G
MVSVLLEIVSALASEKAVPVGEALAGATPNSVSADAQAIARSLASGRKVAVWLGNLAQQGEHAYELQALANEIARLTGGTFGVIGEAANSVGGYLADAIPSANGLNARKMIEQPLKAYLLLNAEPDRDFANPSATMASMSAAELVVALSAFRSPALLAVADVLLPVSPFTETSGSFVNCEGRVQSFNAVARPQGETRPAWKVLRVLGNLLGLEGFDQNDSEAVVAEVLSREVAPRLGNGLSGGVLGIEAAVAAGAGLERVSDVPIYLADPLVRRADALQRTRDAASPVARASSATLAALGIAPGAIVRLGQGGGSAELAIVADDGVAENCVCVSAAHAATASLGAMCGAISVERV